VRILIGAVFAVVILAGCGQSDESKDEMDSIAKIRVAKERVQKFLKNPESATFTKVYITKVNGRKTVCGYVNAKNSFGGYAGNERFFSTGSIVALESQGFKDFDEIWDSFCAK